MRCEQQPLLPSGCCCWHEQAVKDGVVLLLQTAHNRGVPAQRYKRQEGEMELCERLRLRTGTAGADHKPRSARQAGKRCCTKLHTRHKKRCERHMRVTCRPPGCCVYCLLLDYTPPARDTLQRFGSVLLMLCLLVHDLLLALLLVKVPVKQRQVRSCLSRSCCC